MKPIAALTESGMPATSSANAPPVSANGTVARIASALRPDLIAAYSRPSTSQHGDRHDDLEALRSARCWFSNSPPQTK